MNGSGCASASHETLDALLERLEAWVRNTLPLSKRAPRTIESYEGTVRLHLIPGLGRIPLAKLTPGQVQAFLREELAAGKGRRTVQLSHAVLRMALAQAESWGLVPRNVAKLVEGPGGGAIERQPFTVDERTSVLSAAGRERLFPLFVMAAATGLRLSELLGLRWQDIDFELGEVHVRYQLGSKTRKLEPLKTPASRRALPLPPGAIAVLREHRCAQAQQRLSASVWDDQGFVFCTRVGTALSQRNVTRVWDRVVSRAGVQHRGIHHLRHAYGTSLAERGVHERVTQYLLGHADSRTTREIYTHTTDRMLQLAVQAAGEAFDEAFSAPNGSPNGSPEDEVDGSAAAPENEAGA